MNKHQKKIMDELAKEYPNIYELKYMNADTPRMSGQHYLSWGYKEGYKTAMEQTKKLVEILEFYADRNNWERSEDELKNKLIVPAWKITGWNYNDFDESDIDEVDTAGKRARKVIVDFRGEK